MVESSLPGFSNYFWTVAMVELAFFAVSSVTMRWQALVASEISSRKTPGAGLIASPAGSNSCVIALSWDISRLRSCAQAPWHVYGAMALMFADPADL